MEETKKDEEKQKSIRNVGISGTSSETVQRYGSGNSEHFAADAELAEIAKRKRHPDYKDANTKQQAGFSAEVKTVARENAEKAIEGKTKRRTTRTDNMETQSDGRGHTVGGKNEPLYDIAEVDKNGVYVEGSARQLKFVGGDPEQCADRLLNKSFDKYRDADVPIEVPSDFYDDVKKRLDADAEKLKKQVAAAEKRGDTELAAKKRKELDRVKKTSKNLRKGKVSNAEAIFAREHPHLSTALDIADVSHRAGIEAAKSGVIFGGSISAIQNIVAIAKGEKEADEAAADFAKDAAATAVVSYGTGFAGSAIKGGMESSGNEFLKTLATKTNAPAQIVTVALEAGKTLFKYAKGEISEAECVRELGEKGTGMLGGAALGAYGSVAATAVFGKAVSLPFTILGQAAIPIPVVGMVIGSMVGYALSTMFYGNILAAFEGAELARERRIQIEKECEEAIRMMRQYRAEMEEAIEKYLKDYSSAFRLAFDGMKEAMRLGDVDGFISGANAITEKLGGNSQFRDKEEFDKLMADKDIALVL
jgi:hypothetical protein